MFFVITPKHTFKVNLTVIYEALLTFLTLKNLYHSGIKKIKNVFYNHYQTYS